LIADLQAKREPLVQAMMGAVARVGDIPSADGRQFMVGFYDLLLHAAEGDLGPRDQYLETIVPGVRAAGMTLEYSVAQMMAMAMAIASVVAPEHLPWHVTFLREYVTLMYRQWITD
jgi:hypothetical protein